MGCAAQEELQAVRATSGGAGQAAAVEKVVELEARCAALEEQATELMAEGAMLAEEGLAKDEEIEALEGKLAHALRQAAAGSAQVSAARLLDTQSCAWSPGVFHQNRAG